MQKSVEISKSEFLTSKFKRKCELGIKNTTCRSDGGAVHTTRRQTSAAAATGSIPGARQTFDLNMNRLFDGDKTKLNAIDSCELN